MENKESVMTKERVEELEKELDNLKIVRRKEVAEKIKVARSFGDLSENSEYDEAKNEQAMLENRILQIEKALTNVKVVSASDINTDHVGVYSTVKIRNTETRATLELTIVGSSEINPSQGRISDESPVGKALLGKGVGETVEVLLPSGSIVNYKVLDISKSE